MPYFARIGYPCIALSLRGTYKTSAGLVNKVKIDQHVEDVLYLLEYMHKQIFEEENNGKCDDTLRLFFRYISASISSKDDYIAPVLIAHSFGGLTCMKLLERLDKESTKQRPLLSTIALLCSVPPSGITKMSMRALKRNPLKGWRIMKGLAMKKAVSDAKLCRMLFFDQEVSNDDMDKYMTHFQEDSKVTLDLRDLADKLPALDTDSNGCSTCIKNGVLQYQALVLGGTEDFIVDSYAVKETARYLCANNSAIDKKSRCKLVMVKGAVHDVMLANCWMERGKRARALAEQYCEDCRVVSPYTVNVCKKMRYHDWAQGGLQRHVQLHQAPFLFHL